MSVAHGVDDLYQGVVPALLPFLVVERHYTYAAVSGLTLAATVLSSVAQPAFGWLTDRRPRRWIIPAGMTVAGVGIAASGLFSTYLLTWLAVAVSGLGVAAFHPEAARAARQASGDSTRAMSVFALGGNVGYAVGPLLATPVLLTIGVRGTPLLILPVLVMAAVLSARLSRVLDGRAGRRRASMLPVGVDDWPAFGKLTAVVIVRSILFFGLSTFLALHFIRDLGASTGQAGAVLTVFLVAGASGTLLGGWLADRAGRLICIRLGFSLAIPAVAGLAFVTNRPLAVALVVLTGIAVYLPFSVFVVLGQDYLPNRIGTASGVTVGLAVSVGGLATPALGALADATSLRTVLAVLVALPVIALALSTLLHDPRNRSDADARPGPLPGVPEPARGPGRGSFLRRWGGRRR
ncbi:MFS transporter, FSR family, fosmidomycin resistance protein [Modestobacter sp. DSM 44400]|uniref:MFS transporter n=1 Tax=Modestobacter sp. DSM 44400 TaxID=1550230 RepID=UPI00089D4C04|nr:MFS transporter [Modestobacter sp. DSM 44400]SDX80621.1 MFS transporter, FSR family, fosmidomycin resistance protein [Modestobacter sp. DSM 44400]